MRAGGNKEEEISKGHWLWCMLCTSDLIKVLNFFF